MYLGGIDPANCNITVYQKQFSPTSYTKYNTLLVKIIESVIQSVIQNNIWNKLIWIYFIFRNVYIDMMKETYFLELKSLN